MRALPHFSPDDDGDDLPAAVRDLRAATGRAEAILVCTPEYAGALPGAFKNLLEWLVGGGEAYRKPIAWINVSGPAAPSGGRRRARLAAQGRRLPEHGDRRGGLRAHPGRARRHRRGRPHRRPGHPRAAGRGARALREGAARVESF